MTAQPKLDAAEALLAAHPSEARFGWIDAARAGAAARLRQMGAPARRDEYWRFTKPDALLGAAPDTAPGDAIADPGDAPLRAVFVDGVLRPELSTLAGEGVEIEPLGRRARPTSTGARPSLGCWRRRATTGSTRPLAALNTARATQGLMIRVAGDAPALAIEYRRDSAGGDALIHHVIKLEAGTSFTLLEAGTPAARANVTTEVDLAAGARFDHIRLQAGDHDRTLVTHQFVRLAEEAVAKSFTLGARGTFTRNESILTLAGDRAAAHIAGALIAPEGTHHDDTVFVTHAAEDCESRQVFKNVVRDEATCVFQGKILVKEGAQRTDGYQISQGLLLDAAAQFLAKPELEIYADDVACSHGSTVGTLDPTSLFYLTSRGVPRAEAERLLVLAFLDEAIAEIRDAARADQIRDLTARLLA